MSQGQLPHRGYVLLLEHEHFDWFHLNVTGSELLLQIVRIPHNLYLCYNGYYVICVGSFKHES